MIMMMAKTTNKYILEKTRAMTSRDVRSPVGATAVFSTFSSIRLQLIPPSGLVEEVQDCVTVRIDSFVFQVPHQAPACDDEHAIAHHHLRQFRRKQQDGTSVPDKP